ncbi:MAG: kinase [Nitrospirae bacterium]|nr:kinase [Nitrospirota bacterium]
MILSRTPYRISFFGGGTDYPVWYREHGGAVISTTIDKYCYISCRYLPPFFEHKHRIVYSKSEEVIDISEIKHPAVREAFNFMKITQGLEIHHDGDLPARTGLGSSSSFTVGLLKCLYALRGEMVTRQRLTKDALYVEQEMIKENVGSQDQTAAAYGGFNKISFHQNGSITVSPIIMPADKLRSFQKHIMLYFTGFSRYASEIAGEQIKKTAEKKTEINTMYQMVAEGLSILGRAERDIVEFGKLLHESWMIKRNLTDKITTPYVDEIYEEARRGGAIGGKLIGAGGGGFIILFVKPQDQPEVRQRLKKLLQVPFRFDNSGSQIVVYQPNLSYCVDDVCQ